MIVLFAGSIESIENSSEKHEDTWIGFKTIWIYNEGLCKKIKRLWKLKLKDQKTKSTAAVPYMVYRSPSIASEDIVNYFGGNDRHVHFTSGHIHLSYEYQPLGNSLSWTISLGKAKWSFASRISDEVI